jgi:hypothetical protein
MSITVKQAVHTLETKGNYTLDGSYTTAANIENNLKTQNILSKTTYNATNGSLDVDPSVGDVILKVKAVGLPTITDTIALKTTNIAGVASPIINLSEGDILEGPFLGVNMTGAINGNPLAGGQIQTWEKV